MDWILFQFLLYNLEAFTYITVHIAGQMFNIGIKIMQTMQIFRNSSKLKPCDLNRNKLH